MSGATAPGTSKLRTVARRATGRDPRAPGQGPASERCDLCAEPLDPEHRHLLDLLSDAVSCACRPCSLLFDHQEAGGAHYRLLPQRRLRLSGHPIDDALWAALGVPVELAFFTRAGSSGDVTARYPSPLGTLRAPTDPGVWARVTGAHPDLATLEDDVEALLVHRAGERPEHWLLPLDDCYRLAALVRAHWTGLGGGAEVWRHVGAFFDELRVLPEHSGPDTSSTAQEATWVSP
ncbi:MULTISPECIES: DUF5947 family protein [unclassified Streptomyces]|uniref:DUF5947 family protein n=1 Tax=unclassified Streptomyces TaxID=2593676 RepID=UPI0022B652F9|nr:MULTISPECIES: DUF5947 family protein [unclassified Streptomyces]MCZ7416869.1 DUF5947 family protein [Streptomyces sp. WMMC897]MCZ7433314.1 DUF5947 family protein [Streptomyces sp. WMMC1477]